VNNERDVMENRIIGLEHDRDRHEKLFELLRERLDKISEALTRVSQQLADRPMAGDSAFCRGHMSMIEDLKQRVVHVESELDAVRILIAKWGGGIALACFLGVLFGPSIRSIFHLPSDANHTAKQTVQTPARP